MQEMDVQHRDGSWGRNSGQADECSARVWEKGKMMGVLVRDMMDVSRWQGWSSAWFWDECVGESKIGGSRRERLGKVVVVGEGIECGSNISENLRVVILVFG